MSPWIFEPQELPVCWGLYIYNSLYSIFPLTRRRKINALGCLVTSVGPNCVFEFTRVINLIIRERSLISSQLFQPRSCPACWERVDCLLLQYRPTRFGRVTILVVATYCRYTFLSCISFNFLNFQDSIFASLKISSEVKPTLPREIW